MPAGRCSPSSAQPSRRAVWLPGGEGNRAAVGQGRQSRCAQAPTCLLLCGCLVGTEITAEAATQTQTSLFAFLCVPQGCAGQLEAISLREASCSAASAGRHSPYGSSLVVMPISSDVFGTLLSTAGTCSGCSACCCFLFKYFLQSSSAKTQQQRHVRLP